MRDSTPITTAETVRAYRRLPSKEAEIIQRAAEKLQAKTGMKLTECLQVFASIGMLMVRRGE